MGDKLSDDGVVVAAQIPKQVNDLLELYCGAKDRSKSWLIRSLLVSWANNQRKRSKAK